MCIIEESKDPNIFTCKMIMTDKWGVNRVTNTSFIEKKMARWKNVTCIHIRNSLKPICTLNRNIYKNIKIKRKIQQKKNILTCKDIWNKKKLRFRQLLQIYIWIKWKAALFQLLLFQTIIEIHNKDNGKIHRLN